MEQKGLKPSLAWVEREKNRDLHAGFPRALKPMRLKHVGCLAPRSINP